MNVRNFTPRAAQVMYLAEQEAKRLGFNFIGTEHILLGIVRLGEESSAAKILSAFHLELSQIKTETENCFGQGPWQKGEKTEPFPLSPRSRKVLSLAGREMALENLTYIGTEHILLGLLREGEGVAPRVLLAHGVTLDLAREKVRELCSSARKKKEAEAQDLGQLVKTAKEFLENPIPGIHFTPRVLAALCAVNHLTCEDDVREELFLAVLGHLRVGD